MKLYFTRHGESEANVLQVISNRGQRHPLTEQGRQQAQLLAGKLGSAGITGIYTSPLLRAVQTAEILSEAFGVGFEITDALREYDCGILEGTAGAETWAAFWALREAWWPGLRWERRMEGGESFLDMQARFVPFIEGLLATDNQRNQNLILIGHGGLYICMLPLVLVNVDFDIAARQPFPNTGYVLAESDSPGSGSQGSSPQELVCREWCGAPVA
jgi:2,3-bisphosphoglycerate-dependent phosphoglycerate mutase